MAIMAEANEVVGVWVVVRPIQELFGLRHVSVCYVERQQPCQCLNMIVLCHTRKNTPQSNWEGGLRGNKADRSAMLLQYVFSQFGR